MLGAPLAACLIMTVILGYLGIHVLKREVIFIDIALAQVAAVGAIVAHMAFGAGGHSLAGHACALLCVLAAAAFYAVVRRRVPAISLEVVIGVSYAIAAAAALFLVGMTAEGHCHVHRMLAGSLLWTDRKDVLVFAVCFAAAGAGLFAVRRPLAAISEDYQAAGARGMSVAWWDFVFYALAGVVITIAVRLAGVVVVFGLLIMPATASALFASSWRRRLALTWALGAAGSAAGMLFAKVCDFSLGPAVVLFLGIILTAAGLLRALLPGAAPRA
jgi:zinc/manganese transport system permease protein